MCPRSLSREGLRAVALISERRSRVTCSVFIPDQVRIGTGRRRGEAPEEEHRRGKWDLGADAQVVLSCPVHALILWALWRFCAGDGGPAKDPFFG